MNVLGITMTKLGNDSIFDRIKLELKIPKNYRSRLQAQLKRYEGTKSPQELKDHILSDWKRHSNELEDYWKAADKIHDDFLGDLIRKHLNLEIEIMEKEEMIKNLMGLRKEGCKALFHEQRIAALKEYISIGINPEQAAEMVMDTDRHCNTLSLEKRIEAEYKKWQNRDY